MVSPETIASLQGKYGTYQQDYDLNTWTFYDFVTYPTAGATQLSFFTAPLGTVDANSGLAKTYEQTNCSGNRQLNYDFIVMNVLTRARIKPKNRQPSGISGDTNILYTEMGAMMPKFLELMRVGVLSISFGQKQYYQLVSPLQTCSPGYGLKIFSFASVKPTATTLTQNSWAQQSYNSKPYGINPEQFIEGNTQLTITMDYTATSPVFTGLVGSADPAIELGVVLAGYIIRPLQ